MPTNFVDRAEHLSTFEDVLDGLGRRQSRVLVIEGRAGIGKSALLGQFRRLASSGQSAPLRVATTRCFPQVGEGYSYLTAYDLLLQLHEEPERPTLMRRLLTGAGRGVAQSAPEALSTLVPGLGAIWQTGRAVTAAALDSGSLPMDSVMPMLQGAAVRIAEAVLEVAGAGRPSVVLVDDLQFIDQSSLLVLEQLVHRMHDVPMALVLSHAHDSFAPSRSATGVGALLERWVSEGVAERHALAGLPPFAVEELVRLSHPGAPAGLSDRLVQLTEGHALFVAMCLAGWKREHGAEPVLPPSLSRMVLGWLDELDEPDRRLVLAGAAQGKVFLSRTVADLIDADHEEVMDRLHRIARRTELIAPQPAPPWAEQEKSDCYGFQHGALWQVVYGQQTEEQRRGRHERIARSLLNGREAAGLPLARQLEVAYHLERGGRDCLAETAELHHALARSAALTGLSYVEAEHHCEVAIRAARDLPPGPLRDRQLVSSIELLLSLTEVRWRGQAEVEPDVGRLSAEAEQAALRSGDPRLIARTTLLRGKALLATRGLEPSLEKLAEAVRRAEESGDRVALYVAKVEYGRQVSKRRLADGLAQLREVEEMYAADPELAEAGDPVLQHARNLGEMQLAVSLFDTGLPSEALDRLLRCTARLRQEVLKTELPIALNYLAQVYASLGAWPQAEAALTEALAFEQERGVPSGWHAYNLALYAQLAVRRPERSAEALATVEEAWQETEQTWLVNLVPIVRNLYAGTLLELSAGRNELIERADRLATDTYVETGRTGMVRSRIAALVLRARTHLLRGDTSSAGRFADEAVAELDRAGDMPALRSEEVFYYAALAVAAAGDERRGRELAARALAVVNRKAGQVTDAALRRSFLDMVPLNRHIRALNGED